MPALPLSGCSLPEFPAAHDGNVTFVVGTLEGDPVKLKLLKDYISRALCTLVNSLAACSFNVIHFSQEVTKWCNRAVTCTPETTAEAASWVQTLECGPGASPTDALAAAFEDAECQAVYLVMDALPGSVLQDIYSLVIRHKNTCSVHVLYLLGDPCDSQVEGSFKMVKLQPYGSSQEVSCNGSFRSIHSCKSPGVCPLQSTMYPEVRMPPCSCNHVSQELPAAITVQKNSVNVSPEALCILRGARVLARRETDGYYYLGHIAHEVEGSRERFLIEFEKCRSLKGKAQFRMQETSVYDIIHYEDARWKPLVPGHHVLAPLESNMEQYGPGTVLQGAESRTLALACESSGVLVTFWNGKTKRIPPGLAVWIPPHVRERITLELQMPLEARKKLVDSCSGYPYIVPPGYRASRCESQEMPGCGPGSHSCLYCRPSQGLCHRCHVHEEPWAAMSKSMSQGSKMTLTKEKPRRNLEKEKGRKQEAPSEVSLRREKTKKRSIQEPKEDQAVECPKEPLNTDGDTRTKRFISAHSSPVKSVPKTTEGSSMTGAIKTSSKPSPTSLGNMTHLQAALHSIDKAMEEDRRALQAAIRERRPRAAPVSQSYELGAQKSQELRERKERTKDDLWRMHAEQRPRRKEENKEEVKLRDQMLPAGRRLKSQQRIQLDLERKQDQEGIEVRQAESCRAATEERNKKQEQVLETEQGKEGQRVWFWGDRQREEQEEKREMLLHSRMETQQRKQESDIQEWHRHQQLQETARRRATGRREHFYRKAEQESQKDKDLQQYLKEHNLQALRSAMVL